MSSFVDHFNRHLRLEILRVLAEAPAGQANALILTSAVRDLGLSATGDQVRAAIDWLAEIGLLSKGEVNGLIVATLKERGEDVARGRAKVDGVQRPSHAG